MIKGIQITGSTNNALLNSFWLLDDQTNETRCLVAKEESGFAADAVCLIF